MKQVEHKHSNKLLWISTAIFAVEYLAIIGYNWLLGGHLGDASLTISRFVGLNIWSIAIFCILNIAICILVVCHLVANTGSKSFVWRFLMYGFVIAFMALSISPHLQDEGISSDIHKFFAGTMFVIMALVGILTMATTKKRWLLVFGTLFVIYGIFFIVCDLMRVDFFMNNILWFESAYLFAFFGLLLGSSREEVA